MTWCVYALAGRTTARLRTTGLSGERLRLVGAGTLGAVTGELGRAPAPTPANVRRYDEVIRALGATFPALLPARFGTCFTDPEELTFILRARGASLRAALAHVRGRVQMNVRIVRDARTVGTDEPQRFERLERSGASYLRARAAQAQLAREIEGFEPVRSAVRRWVRDERVEKRAEVASVYHLVPRGSVAAYRRALEASAADARLRVVVTGPFPPYAFADPL